MNRKLYIGLMSGTSADGIDLALVDFSTGRAQMLANFYQAYAPEVSNKISTLYSPNNNEIDRAFTLDVDLAHLFAKAISDFLAENKLQPSDIKAIGNHGQTIRHRPTQAHPFTLQIGCSQTLACLTGIEVIGQFRRKDMAYNGQGAPLVPAFHQAIFSDKKHDVTVVNIGGIANITYLPVSYLPDTLKTSTNQKITGFDTGPGNALLDDWYMKHHQGRYDENGAWAKLGQVDTPLLDKMLGDNYFNQTAPKSTGREYFNAAWLAAYIANSELSTPDIQATLTELTARTICDSIKQLSASGLVYLCGGGAHNQTLCERIEAHLPEHKIKPTKDKNMCGDALEAVAFAWLAYAYQHNISGNIPAVTGAHKAVVLGTSYKP